MQPSNFPKFGFRIRTRAGSTVDNLVIAGQDETEAVRKLRQMYRDCEILECVPQKEELRTAAANFEDVAGLISGAGD
jgi:ribosome-binding ATPase YchF (GTP1/OBG family)